MTREIEILNLLLDRYERSGHCLPGRESGRRVMLHMKRDYADYRENNPFATEVNHTIQGLEEEGFVSFSWCKGYEGWLLDEVWLNLNSVDEAYIRAKREPLSTSSDALYYIVCQTITKIRTPWKLRFLEEEAERLRKSLRPSRLLPRDIVQAEAIMKVLQYTENGPELMRVISTNCFRDSKYLERNILSQLVSITKAYDPDLVEYRAMGNEYLTQNVVLKQLGIITYPEILEFCGNIHLAFPATQINTEAFENGFCFQSENLHLLSSIELSCIKTLLFVENRTNYRRLVLQGIPDTTLVIYHGGFYSPVKRRLFHMMSDSAGTSRESLFWGDIDLGGFLMFTRLKRDLFPNLIPWKMGLEDFERYKACGIRQSTSYLGSLQNKLEEKKIDPIFFPVARAMLKEGVTIEQEIMI